MKKIVLIGFAACFKTSVGKLLADRLGFAFVDTDSEIERLENMSVQQIFERYGEPYFRKRESELLRTLPMDNTVVACGGGSVLSSDFDECVRNAIVIDLTACAETVHARLGAVPRPLFDGLTVDELRIYMQKRAPLYAKYANAVFPTDGKSAEQVAEQVMDYLSDI